jgi:hypothetical protein
MGNRSHIDLGTPVRTPLRLADCLARVEPGRDVYHFPAGPDYARFVAGVDERGRTISWVEERRAPLGLWAVQVGSRQVIGEPYAFPTLEAQFNFEAGKQRLMADVDERMAAKKR